MKFHIPDQIDDLRQNDRYSNECPASNGQSKSASPAASAASADAKDQGYRSSCSDPKPVIELKQAQLSDLQDVLQILSDGKRLQRAQGFIQWEDDFPNPEEIRIDLLEQEGYLLMINNQKAGYVKIASDEPAYLQKTARWSAKAPYYVLHRVALKQEFAGKGLSKDFLEACRLFARQNHIPWLRIDTHADNHRMQHVLQKNGWKYCGTVEYPFGSRLVYELLV